MNTPGHCCHFALHDAKNIIIIIINGFRLLCVVISGFIRDRATLGSTIYLAQISSGRFCRLGLSHAHTVLQVWYLPTGEVFKIISQEFLLVYHT